VEHVHIDIADKIATVTFERPPVNALDAQSLREIAGAFRSLAAGTEASVVIFTAPGDRVFCGGIDLDDSRRRYARELAGADTAVDLLDPGAIVRDCFWSVLDCPLPVIGAVNGAAVGAGLALVASCDVVIASGTARFALPEINAGVLGGGRHTQRLVGTYKARKMLFTGDFVPAAELLALGAVEAVVASAELMPTARRLALRIAAKSPIGLRLAKESMNRVEDLALKEGYRIEQDYTARVVGYHDSAEARAAYREQREPDWTWT
jgi:enoyl-CoA hydratase